LCGKTHNQGARLQVLDVLVHGGGHAAVRVVRKHTWMQGTMGRRHDATAHLGCAGKEVLLGDDGVDVEKKSSSVTASRRAWGGVQCWPKPTLRLQELGRGE
jgi:hypothetical protein